MLEKQIIDTAFREGVLAYQHAQLRDSNPYHNPDCRHRWYLGYDTAYDWASDNLETIRLTDNRS